MKYPLLSRMLRITSEYKLKDYTTPVPRQLMDKEEIEWCEQQVKLKKMRKGVSDDKQKSVIYYADLYDVEDEDT